MRLTRESGEEVSGDSLRAAPSAEPTNGWSSGTIRFRLTRKFRNGLIMASVASALSVTLLTMRANRSRAAVTEFYNEYNSRGGDFTFPAALHSAADRDKITLVVAIFIALAVWSVVVVVWTLRRTRLRLDSDGLWWTPAHGLRWRGPITRDEVVAMQPGARKKHLPIRGIPFMSFGNRSADRLGIYDVTLLYLRSEAGFKMKRAGYMELPQPPPKAANSLIVVPEALFRTNPKFLKSLRSWILS